MTEVTTINTNNYAAMAEAMGMSIDTTSSNRQASTLARLRIHHSAIMGQEEVKGKTVNLEVVPAGTYKLEIPDGPTYYANKVTIRPYMQRFMYKKFEKGNDTTPNRYVKTVMANDLNSDMKDNDGGFNCGKPAGFIKDWAGLPQKIQDLIRQIKRVRVLFGTAVLHDPVDETGKPVTLEPTAFIWEVENRDAFKTIGGIFTKLGNMKRLPPQHTFSGATEERNLPNGNSFFLPTVALNLQTTLEMDDDTQENFSNFLAWISNYNDYICNSWNENMHKHEEVDTETVDSFVDIDEEELV